MAVFLTLAALALFALAPARAQLPRHPTREHEPRLVLPGALAPRPGQVLDLRWSAAATVTELEILLSADGGATFSECTPLRLDPALGRVRWRVPEGDARRMRLRIRYNVDGREIEGAPVRLVAADDAGADAPLALPVGGADPGPARGGERSSGAAGEGLWAAEERLGPGTLRDQAATHGMRLAPDSHRTFTPAARTRAITVDRTPGFVPLRT
jgi:hypothetical protein